WAGWVKTSSARSRGSTAWSRKATRSVAAPLGLRLPRSLMAVILLSPFSFCWDEVVCVCRPGRADSSPPGPVRSRRPRRAGGRGGGGAGAVAFEEFAQPVRGHPIARGLGGLDGARKHEVERVGGRPGARRHRHGRGVGRRRAPGTGGRLTHHTTPLR